MATNFTQVESLLAEDCQSGSSIQSGSYTYAGLQVPIKYTLYFEWLSPTHTVSIFCIIETSLQLYTTTPT